MILCLRIRLVLVLYVSENLKKYFYKVNEGNNKKIDYKFDEYQI